MDVEWRLRRWNGCICWRIGGGEATLTDARSSVTVDGEMLEGLGRSDISSRRERAVMAGRTSVGDGSDTVEGDGEDEGAGGGGDMLSSRASRRRRESCVWMLSMMSWRVDRGDGGGGVGGGGDSVAAVEGWEMGWSRS